mgnify:CR=1 FL=1
MAKMARWLASCLECVSGGGGGGGGGKVVIVVST